MSEWPHHDVRVPRQNHRRVVVEQLHHRPRRTLTQSTSGERAEATREHDARERRRHVHHDGSSTRSRGVLLPRRRRQRHAAHQTTALLTRQPRDGSRRVGAVVEPALQRQHRLREVDVAGRPWVAVADHLTTRTHTASVATASTTAIVPRSRWQQQHWRRDAQTDSPPR